jgi:hypothetical protein
VSKFPSSLAVYKEQEPVYFVEENEEVVCRYCFTQEGMGLALQARKQATGSFM